ncbi:MAG: YcgN family cysteine cluster protein [Gammaproteobacteria bacterium]
MSFWKTKKLAEMSIKEWESLCDNCGKCCLHKLEDEDTGDIYFTSAACNLIDLDSCRCTHYAERTKRVPECLDIRKLAPTQYSWLPATCAYRLLNNNEDLPNWHPLISGNTNSVPDAGVSISSYAVKESEVEDLEDYIIEWLE